MKARYLVFKFLLITSLHAADKAQVLEIRYADLGKRERIEILCSQPVRYTSTTAQDPDAILVYLRDAVLPADSSRLVPPALASRLDIRSWMEHPPVVKISLRYAGGGRYSIFSIDDSNMLVIEVSREADRQEDEKSATEAVEEAPKPSARAFFRKLSNGARITADFRDADIANVLRLFARQNSLNIVASDSVRGRVTVTLHNVTLEQALESILRANGYKYILENGILLVKPANTFNLDEMETRVYRLNYIDAHNLKQAVEELISTEGKIKVLATGFHNRKDVYEVNDQAPPEREKRYWQRSSVLIVTDFTSNLKAIDKLVSELDVAVPQIMIEARLIEVSPLDNSNIGIDWTKALKLDIYDAQLLESGGLLEYSSRTELPNKNRTIQLGTLNTSQFGAVINYLKENTRTRLVSNPRIVAMDNEPSDISVGTTFPIPQINRGVGGQGDIVTFTYRDVNITLRVIPHVINSNTISMYVNPIIEEVTGEVTVEGNSAPITSKREVDTVVKVRDGDTIVIGGMIKEKEVVSVRKVWLLGSIPLLGHLFRNKSVSRQQTDLLIFITPKIVVQ